MKFNYCPSCGMAFNKTRFEKDRCVNCGKRGSVLVEVKRNIFVYLAYVTFILGAAMVYLKRDVFALRWGLFFGFLLAGAFLSVAGMGRMRLDAKDKGERMLAEAEKRRAKDDRGGPDVERAADFTCTNCDGDAYDEDEKCRHCGEPFDA